MEIRKATPGDLEGIRAVYAAAKAFMDAHGNASQWEPGYPDSVIPGDIANGNCFVETENGVIHGAWRNDDPYAAIHRLGSDGALPGFTGRCFDFCKGLCPDLRADTHEHNTVMQHLLEKNGFLRCGTIITTNGTPRIAYHFVG